ncbi:MAG TPA: DUF695 domain-containing protein [Kofleriaceae bacterium]
MTTDGELWHDVEAKRDDGTPTMFRIRELDPQRELTKIFVVELPYPKTELSRLPTASDYRRLAEFDEQWLRPACSTLGWELVGSKTEDGSFFLYMYGCSDPSTMIEKLSPFDAALGFYDDDDPDWEEYGTLRDLLDQAKAIPAAAPRAPDTTTRAKAKSSADQRPAAKRPAAKRPAAKRKLAARPKAKAAKKTRPRPKSKVKRAQPKRARAKA